MAEKSTEKSFKERFKQLREERGFTQQQVAEVAEIHRHTISAYESGDVLPSLDRLVKIANFYNVSIDYLCGVSDMKFTTKFDLGDDLGLTPESISKMQQLARMQKERPLNFGIDFINYLLQYGSTEFFEFMSEYLNVPLIKTNEIYDFTTNRKGKIDLVKIRKQKAEEYLIIEELKTIFDKIKDSKEVKEKYLKYKGHIENIDRPFNVIPKKVQEKIVDDEK